MMTSSARLERFIEAQAGCYESVRTELAAGHKKTHWMWFVFPQMEGLGQSTMARKYAIQSRQEAVEYQLHSLLGTRLRECIGLMLAVKGRSAFEILGTPDDIKFRSSMTLFAEVAGGEPIFSKALERFYSGKPDLRTLELLKTLGS